jgi:hypothetical protein
MVAPGINRHLGTNNDKPLIFYCPADKEWL